MKRKPHFPHAINFRNRTPRKNTTVERKRDKYSRRCAFVHEERKLKFSRRFERENIQNTYFLMCCITSFELKSAFGSDLHDDTDKCTHLAQLGISELLRTRPTHVGLTGSEANFHLETELNNESI